MCAHGLFPLTQPSDRYIQCTFLSEELHAVLWNKLNVSHHLSYLLVFLVLLHIFFLSLNFGLSFHPTSSWPQFDPGIFSVWCTIIRPSLYSLRPTLQSLASLSCPILSLVFFFCLSFLFLLSTLLCCLSLNLSSSVVSFFSGLSLPFLSFTLSLCL